MGKTAGWLVATGAVLLIGVGAGGAGTGRAAEGASTACAPAEGVTREVAPEAELQDLSCTFGDYKGKRSLHLHVKLENVSAEPHRFRVNLFLDNGKAVGGLVPRKGDPPAVAPGETAEFTYPVQGMDEKPQRVEVFVKTIDS